MDVTLRPGAPHDAEAAGRICHEAFRSIAEAHNVRPGFPPTAVTEEIATTCAGLFTWSVSHGLRVTQLMTLMTIVLDNEPAGSWMPSIDL